jgi:hypothetical protein
MNILDICLKNPEVCEMLRKIEILNAFRDICLRHPEICFNPPVIDIPVDICKICPVCCYGNPRLGVLDKIRDVLFKDFETYTKLSSIMEEIINPGGVLEEDEVVVFVPVVIKRPKTISQLELIVKSGGVVADKELSKKVEKVLL